MSISETVVRPLENIEAKSQLMAEQGFVKLKGFLDSGALQDLKTEIQASEIYRSWELHRNQAATGPSEVVTAVNASATHYRDDSNLSEPFFASLAQKSDFAATLCTLAGQPLLRTNNHVYEIVGGEHGGLGWHVGYYSFSYTQITDPGYTLWIPLSPIQTETRGGMQYIPRCVLDGMFLYRFAAWHFDNLRDVPPGQSYIDTATSADSMVNALPRLLEHAVNRAQVIEDTFDLGDALLFDKGVLHRSSPFVADELSTRMALICRFVGSEARYDSDRFVNTFCHLEKTPLSHAVEAGVAPREFDVRSIAPSDPFLRELYTSASALTDSSDPSLRTLEPIVSDPVSRQLGF